MQDRPTVDELLDAVEIFLRETVVERLDGQPRCHARVAANAVSIVRRELALDLDGAAAETNRLEALTGESGSRLSLNEALAALIRSGAADDGAVLDHLRQTTAEKLAIANPRYGPEGG